MEQLALMKMQLLGQSFPIARLASPTSIKIFRKQAIDPYASDVLLPPARETVPMNFKPWCRVFTFISHFPGVSDGSPRQGSLTQSLTNCFLPDAALRKGKFSKRVSINISAVPAHSLAERRRIVPLKHAVIVRIMHFE